MALASPFLARLSTRLSIGAVVCISALALASQVMPRKAAPPVAASEGQPVLAGMPLVGVNSAPNFAPPQSPAIEVAARRRRTHQPAREREQDQSPKQHAPKADDARARKTSAISLPDPGTPVSEVQPKSEGAPAEPPKPDVWSDGEVIGALRKCVEVLAPIVAEVETVQPVKQEQCGAPAAVMLRGIGSGANKVEINPPAMLNCAMVARLHTWVEKVLQPAARESFGAPIARLHSASGYSCRNRNGSATHSDKLSEHALANAIDIGGFAMADGRTIDVAKFWGPTLRDQRAAEQLLAARAQELKRGTGKADGAPVREDGSSGPHKISAIATAEPPAKGKTRSALRTAELNRLPRGASDIGPDRQSVPAASADGTRSNGAEHGVEGAFLRRLHAGACTVFGTVLGPEANDAHRNHFHFDLAPRRHSAFCQ